MRTDFKSELSKLNTEQKEAVSHIEGPLLVIAGPGTGKTQLLSLRAANILRETDVLPENILCLTFTESGAQEMRRRLIKIIGEDAYKITIGTYHSFGSEIIRRNPSYFSGSFNLRPISDLKTDSIIRELQKELPFTSELKNPELVSGLSKLISDAKQALLTPADLRAVASANLEFIKQASAITKPLTTGLARASLKSVETFRGLVIDSPKANLPKGIESLASLWNSELEEAIAETLESHKARSLTKWKAKYLAKDEGDLQIAKGSIPNERLKEFTGLYESYIKQLKDANLYDFNDMILLSIEALKKHDELRFNLQEKYLYIMLDEYQDTNLAQAELTYLLTNNPASEGRPNIMASGDDDQAIFAFQGAKHSNMLDFTRKYEDVKEVTLKSNYRSTQSLINLSSQVVEQIAERLTTLLKGVSKDFKAARTGPGIIKNLNLATEIEEYAWLAKDIKSASSKDIAIIAPEHKYLERASAYLSEQGIAISYSRRENVLDDPLIDQLLTILRLLKAINDKNSRLVDSLAAIVMNYDFWELQTETIWKISWQAHDNHKSWLDVMLDTPSCRTAALMLIKMAANSLNYRYDFIIDQAIGLSDIVINDPKSKSTRSKFLEFYGDSDDLVTYRLFQNLTVIREKFRDFNLDNDRPLMIVDLIDFIDQLKSSNIKLTNDFNYGSSSAGIKLMTAHGSKGLEFDTVYLLSLINEVWGPKSASRRRLALPPNLEYIRQGADDVDDEKLRLLYVAITRAKNKLVTLSYDKDASSKTTTPLKYLAVEPTEVSVKGSLVPLWQVDESPLEIDTDLKGLLKKRLETYSLSATDLNTFINVRHAGPQAFYKSVLLKYKTPVSSRVDYGSAIHNSLQWLQQTLSSTAKLPALEPLLEEFEKQLRARRLPTDDFKHLKEQGIKTLTAYYNANKSSFSKDDISEFDFRGQGIVIGSARVSGQVDKLVVDKKDKTVTIVDYKTGRGYRRWDSEPKLHNYQNQLYFYKQLVEKSSAFKDYKVSGALLDFVEPDKATGEPINLELEYNDDETERLLKLIDAVWQHINELNFPSIAGYKPSLSGIKQFEEDLIAGRI